MITRETLIRDTFKRAMASWRWPIQAYITYTPRYATTTRTTRTDLSSFKETLHSCSAWTRCPPTCHIRCTPATRVVWSTWNETRGSIWRTFTTIAMQFCGRETTEATLASSRCKLERLSPVRRWNTSLSFCPRDCSWMRFIASVNPLVRST